MLNKLTEEIAKFADVVDELFAAIGHVEASLRQSNKDVTMLSIRPGKQQESRW